MKTRLDCDIKYFTLIANTFVEQVCNTFTVSCGKSRMICLTSSTMRNIIVFSFALRIPAQSICCLVPGSKLSTCCLLRSIATSLFFSLRYGNPVRNPLCRFSLTCIIFFNAAICSYFIFYRIIKNVLTTNNNVFHSTFGREFLVCLSLTAMS